MLKQSVRAATECKEYGDGKAIPTELLAALFKEGNENGVLWFICLFPNCQKKTAHRRLDRAKEHAQVHIGNYPFTCMRIQAGGEVGW